MLDELYLTIEPIVFGKGINLFSDGPIPLLSKEGLELAPALTRGEVIKYQKFKLISAKKLNRQGSILLHYKILVRGQYIL